MVSCHIYLVDAFRLAPFIHLLQSYGVIFLKHKFDFISSFLFP